MKDPYAKERALFQQQLKTNKNSGMGDRFFQMLTGELKGEDGYTPIKGKDYFTDAEITAFKKDIESRIRLPEDGKDAEVNYDLVFSYIVDELDKQIAKIPTPRDGEPGPAGKDAVVDIKAIVSQVIAAIPKQPEKILDTESVRRYIDKQIAKIPPQQVRIGGSVASIRALTDVNLDGLSQDAQGNYILGSGSGDSLPDQTGNNGKFLTTDGTDASWATLAGGGDMAAAVYDPQAIAADAFARANHTGSQAISTITDLQSTLDGKAATSHTHTASQVTDFDTEVSNNTDVAANTAARHAAVTVTDSAEIDFTLTGQNITADLVAGSIDESKLDASVNASLDLADSATQPGDALTTLSGDLPFSQIAQIATNRILGRATAGTGDIEALTGSQVRDIAGVDTNDSPQFDGVNVGHATDTTITRVSAGVIAVEGVNVSLAGHTHTASEVTDFSTAADARITAATGVSVQAYDANLPTWPATVDATEVGYLNGVTSALQTQLDAKAASSHTHNLTDVTDVTATAAEVNILDGATLTVTELNYVDGVTSAIQTQLDAKAALADPTFTGNVTVADLQITGEFGADSEVDNGNSSTADTVDWTAGNFQKSTLTGNCTYTFTAPTYIGRFQLKLIQDGTGSRTATWPAAVKWPGGTAPTLSTGAAAIDIISFFYDGTSYYGVDSLNFS